jgi:hypothetical protein
MVAATPPMMIARICWSLNQVFHRRGSASTGSRHATPRECFGSREVLSASWSGEAEDGAGGIAFDDKGAGAGAVGRGIGHRDPLHALGYREIGRDIAARPDRIVLPRAAFPLASVIETSGILQRSASSTSAAAAAGVKVVAAAPMSRWATKETVGCAGLPELPSCRISAFFSTSPMAATTAGPTAATIAGRRLPKRQTGAKDILRRQMCQKSATAL